MIDTVNILRDVAALGGNKSLADVRAALAKRDHGARKAQHRQRYTIQIWDRVSPIEGVPAEHYLARPDVPPDGEIYLIYRDGQLLFFQPHDPEAPGLKGMQNAMSVAQRHVERLAEADADVEITREVVEELLSS